MQPSVSLLTPTEPLVARATAIAQYGELFQGASRDAQGRLHRCLVSLPCTRRSSTAIFEPSSAPIVSVIPGHKRKAARAAELTLAFLAGGIDGGTLRLDSDIPEGKGCGSSTADCIASVLAVASALGRLLTDEKVAELVVTAERASGNVMFQRAVLFAHREGKALEDYRRPLPRLAAIGFDTDPDHVVDTLEFPRARYSPAELEKLHVLLAGLRRAICTGDVPLLGQVASASAEINQRFLPTRGFRELSRLARHVGAVGVAVAHSGTVASLLFDVRDPQHHHRMEQTSTMLDAQGMRDVVSFSLD